MSDHVVELWKQEFKTLSPDVAVDVRKIYTDDVRFEDPIHQITGVAALDAYFRRLNSHIVTGSFEFTSELKGPDNAALFWVMRLKLKRLAKQEIVVPGASHLRFAGNKISSHRDYFDVGAMVYEHIPLMGRVLRAIKRSM